MLTGKVQWIQLQYSGESIYACDDDERSKQEDTYDYKTLNLPKLQFPDMINRQEQDSSVSHDVGNSVSDEDCSQVQTCARDGQIPSTWYGLALEYACPSSTPLRGCADIILTDENEHERPCNREQA